MFTPEEVETLRGRIVSRARVVDAGFASPCWISDRARQPNGYTKLGYRGRTWLTHRLSWIVHRGGIPDGLVIDHLCRQRACVNPDHLEPVSTRTNLLRGEGFVAHQAQQQRCLRGHPLSGDNLYRSPSRPDSRECLTCRREATRRSHARRRAGG
ncbi:HNH endonuclease signature motif containing protein [Micrococcus sp.]|uniref:HNH endonuclease signature motif containing protein n=1 Tax=Micrococcus sp. TaxID=1271 RepID=UPI0026DB6756|nr:HNH endonuclease signature motif containing protein [Micrococcus sp.]MDO4240762.1 HNH endonuclease signature motif containing protein [Micrococcus sp.]